LGPSKAKPPTKAQRQRMDRIAELGCVACRMKLGHRGFDATCHHQTEYARRKGHAATVGLCPWHHFGQVPEGCRDRAQATRDLGPSLAGPEGGSRPFRERFGSDDELLRYQNELLESHAR